MNKYKNILLLVVFMIMASCSVSEFDGKKTASDSPLLDIYDTSNKYSNNVTRVEWSAVDIDNINVRYKYIVTTDTTLSTDPNSDKYILKKLPLDSMEWVAVSEDSMIQRNIWNETALFYAYVSFPYSKKNADVLYTFTDLAQYTDPVTSVTYTDSIVYAKSSFYVFAEDESGNISEVKSKVFYRSNNLPEIAYFRSEQLNLRGFKIFKYAARDSVLVLENETEFWKPIEFNWIGNDPDSQGESVVTLSYKYKLYEVTNGMKDLFIESAWLPNLSKVRFSKELWDKNNQGKYRFELFVKDDAEKVGKDSIVATFGVFPPEFNKGILVLDDTDYNLYSVNNTVLGTPEQSAVLGKYNLLLNEAGYDSTNSDPLKRYDYFRITDIVEPYSYNDTTYVYNEGQIDTVLTPRSGKNYKSLAELTDYRMVIIISEDRSVENGISYNDFGDELIAYLNVGGKVMFFGNSILLDGTKLGDSPYQEPKPMYFTSDTYRDKLFRDYCGLNGYITGEAYEKLWADKANVLNYDFIGAKPLFNNLDTLRLDFVSTAKYWTPVPSIVSVDGLKENASVFTGVSCLITSSAENFYGYRSIYDLKDYNTFFNPDPAITEDSLVVEIVDGDTIVHDLYWKSRYRDAVPSTPANYKEGKVLHRTGSVAARYTGWGTDPETNENVVLFKTSFVTMPLVYMSNSAEKHELENMFSWLIDWYDLEIDPMVKK